MDGTAAITAVSLALSPAIGRRWRQRSGPRGWLTQASVGGSCAQLDRTTSGNRTSAPRPVVQHAPPATGRGGPPMQPMGHGPWGHLRMRPFPSKVLCPCQSGNRSDPIANVAARLFAFPVREVCLARRRLQALIRRDRLWRLFLFLTNLFHVAQGLSSVSTPLGLLVPDDAVMLLP